MRTLAFGNGQARFKCCGIACGSPITTRCGASNGCLLSCEKCATFFPASRQLQKAARDERSMRLMASFLIFSRKFFEAGGFIDDGFFMYAEEFSVAEMCLRLGLPVIHDPDLRVRHEEGQTTGRMLSPERVRSSEGTVSSMRWPDTRDSYPELASTPCCEEDEGRPP